MAAADYVVQALVAATAGCAAVENPESKTIDSSDSISGRLRVNFRMITPLEEATLVAIRTAKPPFAERKTAEHSTPP
jgi:hypothetical protein